MSEHKMIQNPILPGFNPDPSILRVGDDYYIATSTFQWYPGVQIHHSKDLVNWRLLTRPLNRSSQLNMLGETASYGVWAPCLTYDNGTFFLVYTDVKENGTFHNYLVTSDKIDGEWSEPIYLSSRGFDPSLFHDDDGKKYVVLAELEPFRWNALLNFKTPDEIKMANGKRFLEQNAARGRSTVPFGNMMFKGILMQEYDHEKKKCVGPVEMIFKGTSLNATEGPHLYKRNGYYYLICAEGGTSYDHAVTMARSKTLSGPYQVHPENPIITGKNNGDVLQRAGHADYCETPDGDVYMVHLCSRPICEPGEVEGHSVLGRETAIQKMEWRDDWLYLAAGGSAPEYHVIAPELKAVEWNTAPTRDLFNSDVLDINYSWLRAPILDEIMSLTARKGYLRVYGKEHAMSTYKHGFIARRQQHLNYRAETKMFFEPNEENQYAGLLVYYSEDIYYYLYVGRDKDKGKFISIMENKKMAFDQFVVPEVFFDQEAVTLRAEVTGKDLQYYYSLNGQDFVAIGQALDMRLLSDETAGSGFTGAFVGMACHDPITMSLHADFDYFDYEGK